jgi:hypothetical protein
LTSSSVSEDAFGLGWPQQSDYQLRLKAGRPIERLRCRFMSVETPKLNPAVRMKWRRKLTGETYERTGVFDAQAEDVLDALERAHWCTADFERRDGLRQVLYGSSVVDVQPTDDEPTRPPRWPSSASAGSRY